MRTITKYLSMLAVVLSILVFASQTKAQITLLTEGWETGNGTTPPAGWAIDQLGYGNWITFVTSGSFPATSPYEGSRMVRFDSWDAPTGYQNRLRMSTPISTAGYSNITVDFAFSLQNVFGPGDGLWIEWSTNGTVWTQAGTPFYNNGGSGWVIRTQALPVGAANQATLYVAFHFISNYGYDTYMDICHVKGSQTGNLTGTIRNCFNNALMPAGVSVTCGGVNGLTNAGGVYTLNGINAGAQIITATYAGFTQYNAPVTVVGNTTTTYNFCMNPIPGILSGVVTNCANGNPIVGAKVVWTSTPNLVTYTTAGGAYSLNIYPGATQNLQVSKEGWVLKQINGITVTPPATVTQNLCLDENTPPPSAPFTAVLNAGQTAVNMNWGLPKDDMLMLYDDGIQDNFAIWALGGGVNMNAMKFTPISYPLTVKSFYVNIGTAVNYAAGSNAFSPVQIAVYNEVGGLPGAELSAPTTITPTVYGWTKANFTVPVTIASGNFFIVMIQLGNSSTSPGIAIDTTTQQMRSFSKFGTFPWIPASGNFMLRAVVNGSGGPLTMDNQSGGPITASAVPGLIYQYTPSTVTGFEGSPKVYSEMGYGPDNLLGYQVWRLLQGQEATPALWTSVGTPTATNIVDNSWPSLPCGPYRWGVEAQYTFNRWSLPLFSNAIGKCWTCTVTVNVDMSCDSANATGTLVKLQNTTVVDTSYSYIMTATGTHTFTNFWKGIYTLTVTKYGYTVFTQTPISIMGDMTLNVMLLQVRTPPTGLKVPDTTLLATWFPPSSKSVLFNETFSSGSFATNQWVVDGGSNWSINTVNGNPGQCAQFFWAPQKSNYSYSVTSKTLTGIYSPIMKLNYDIHLDNFSNSTLEQLAVEIFNGSTWIQLKNYDNSSGGNIAYKTETVDISAYASTSFKVRFRAYGEDSFNIDWWDFDNVQVIASDVVVNPNPCIYGYNFYLNNISTGFTPDTFYNIPPSLVTYGSTYHACVLAVYGSGYSTQSCYDFTSHFLCPPNSLTGTALECSAYLSWHKPDCGGCTLATYQYDVGPPYGNALSINVGYQIQNGNYFPVTPPTTTGVIKSFDIWFSQYSTWTTQSCILYVYNTSYVVIGQSAPFQNGPAATWPSGTWINIPVADIPYTGPFYAMVDYYTTTAPKNGMGLDVVTPQPGYPQGLAYGYYQGVFSPATTLYGLAAPETFAIRGNVCFNGKDKDAPITTIDPSQLPVSKSVTPIPDAAVNCGANLDVSAGHLNTPPVPASPDAVTLLGYRVYRNNIEIAIINNPNTLEYYDYDQNPGTYQYKVNAWYNVSPFVPSPAHSQPAGPVSVALSCGYPLPFFEPWNGGSFGYQQWSFDPTQANWSFNTAFGNPTPCADFSWDPIITNYSRSLVTPTINASAWTCADIFCDFDVKLTDRFATGNEKLTVEVLNNGNWVAKGEYTNTGTTNWTMKHIDISNVKGKAFKVRFRANGVNSGDILHWYVDNIHIYGVCHAPQTLAGVQNQFTTTLTWVAPDCPTGGGGPPPQWIHWDDGVNYDAIGTGGAVDFWIAARWDAAQIVPLDGGSITKISFYPASTGTATYSAMIWEGPTPNAPVVNQPIPTVVTDQWNIVTLTAPHPIDISKELWIGVDVNASGGWPAGCDAGPEVDGYGNMIYWTGAWATLISLNPSLTYNWNVQAYVEPTKKEAGARSSVINIKPPVNNLKGQTLGITGKTNTADNASFNSGSGLIIQDSPKGSQLLGYNVYSTDDNQTTPFHKVNLAGPVTSPYTHVHPITTEPTTTWRYFVTAVFQDSLNPGPVLCEPSSDTITITFPAVGINDLANSSITMYPNPANEVVNIVSTNDIKTIEVLNYIGQTVYTNNNVNLKNAKLNVTSFKAGVYFVKVTTTSGIKTTKITVTH